MYEIILDIYTSELHGCNIEEGSVCLDENYAHQSGTCKYQHVRTIDA